MKFDVKNLDFMPTHGNFTLKKTDDLWYSGTCRILFRSTANYSSTLSSRQMNLYILNDVLYDYTSGMAIIAAESTEQCGQIFIEKFGTGSDYSNKERQREFDTADFKVIENVNHPAGVVSYVYGGG